jgi:hypothetical protein
VESRGAIIDNVGSNSTQWSEGDRNAQCCNDLKKTQKMHNQILIIPTLCLEIVLDNPFLQDQVVQREEDYSENTVLQMKIDYNMSGSPGPNDHTIILGGHRVPNLKLVLSHTINELWKQHEEEEQWGFLLVDTANAFNELNRTAPCYGRSDTSGQPVLGLHSIVTGSGLHS